MDRRGTQTATVVVDEEPEELDLAALDYQGAWRERTATTKYASAGDTDSIGDRGASS